jgi:hypothetical protein
MREMIVPEDIDLTDYFTGKPVLDENNEKVKLPFSRILKSLLVHPMFGNGVANVVTGLAIWAAWEKRADGRWVVADEDWAKLKMTLEKPRYEVPTESGPKTVEGFPFASGTIPLLMPYFQSIMDAKQI